MFMAFGYAIYTVRTATPLVEAPSRMMAKSLSDSIL